MGHYIDVGNRLQVVRVSIGRFAATRRLANVSSNTANFFLVLQRLVVAASCAIFYVLAIGFSMTQVVNICLLATLTLLACIEKLCSILNMVSVEKDWVGLHAPVNTNLLLTKYNRLWLLLELIMQDSGVR